jgi:hypothetical protein
MMVMIITVYNGPQWTMVSHPEITIADHGESIFAVAVIGVVGIGIAREEKKGLTLV